MGPVGTVDSIDRQVNVMVPIKIKLGAILPITTYTNLKLNELTPNMHAPL